MNQAIYTVNTYDWTQHNLEPVRIEDWFCPDSVRFGLEYQAPQHMYPSMLYYSTKHELMNRIHNHFEKLQGTVEQVSAYARVAPQPVIKAIGRLNTVCHEIENLVLSERKHLLLPEWTRPCQITTFDDAPRHQLTDDHRKLFLHNGFDRRFGGVYMHWAQIGKTYFEVFRDEGAPVLTETVCEAITHLQYYSGEFDVEWGNDVVYGGQRLWHDQEQDRFRAWLIENNRDPTDPDLSLGYLPIAQVQLQQSFGTKNAQEIWNILGSHLDIYCIEIDGVAQTFDYCWTDTDYKQQQINRLKPGYDYSC
jgi:hypothetical protein